MTTTITNNYSTMSRKEKQEARKQAASMRQATIKAMNGERSTRGIPAKVLVGCTKRTNVGVDGKDTIVVSSVSTFVKVMNTTGKPMVKVMGK